MQKEIEVKIKISFEQEKILKNWLNKNAKKIGDLKITDYYLDNPDNSCYIKSKKGYIEVLNFLRVRITNDENFITFKKRNIDEYGNTLSVDEIETKIDDGYKALEIFKKLNLLDITEIQKNRLVYLYNIYEFAFDKIQQLGDFVEIELKNYNGNVQDGIQKIHDLLKKIGINEFIEYDRGYITIFLNPDHYFGEQVEI